MLLNALFFMPYIKQMVGRLSAKLAAGHPYQINLIKKLSGLHSITNVQILLTEWDQFNHLFYFIYYINGIQLHTMLSLYLLYAQPVHLVNFSTSFQHVPQDIQISGAPICFLMV